MCEYAHKANRATRALGVSAPKTSADAPVLATTVPVTVRDVDVGDSVAVVDDAPDDDLEGTAYEVSESCVDGLAASELIATIDVPDLLICDVMMPRVDGFRFVKLIKADPKFAHMDVIFLTAKGGASTLVQGIQLGARHFISKPFNVKDLLDKVGKLLG